MKAELIDSVLNVVKKPPADTSDKTVKVLIALLFDFSDFSKPMQLRTQSPCDRAWF